MLNLPPAEPVGERERAPAARGVDDDAPSEVVDLLRKCIFESKNALLTAELFRHSRRLAGPVRPGYYLDRVPPRP